MMSDLTVPFSEVWTDIIEQNNINLNNDWGSHNFLSWTTTNANLIGVIDYSDNNDDVDSFDDFCTKEFWVLNVTSNWKGCVIDWVECLETDYYSIEGCDLILH
jgi:hypothetical protein